MFLSLSDDSLEKLKRKYQHLEDTIRIPVKITDRKITFPQAKMFYNSISLLKDE